MISVNVRFLISSVDTTEEYQLHYYPSHPCISQFNIFPNVLHIILVFYSRPNFDGKFNLQTFRFHHLFRHTDGFANPPSGCWPKRYRLVRSMESILILFWVGYLQETKMASYGIPELFLMNYLGIDIRERCIHYHKYSN